MATDPAHLLIVDDLPENLLALEALIRHDGCVVHRASSGEAALALLLEHEFALAILDVQMPGMTGYELAELMRGTEKTRHIPIVFVTAGGRDFDYAFKGYESGAVDVLYKPLDAYAVQSKVGVFVGLYRHRQEVRRQVVELRESRRQQQALLAQLQATKVELQQAVQTRDDFMSMVAHELRTPLGALSIGIEVRQRHVHKGNFAYFQPERIATMLASDLRKVRGMARLIEDLLDVSRIHNGKLSIRPARFDLSQMVQRVTRDVADGANEDGITLDAEPGIGGCWDEFRIEQVLVNLLTNALRYGGGQPIQVRLARVGAQAEISVRDQGVGIAEAEHERIFEPFVRVANRSSAAGLGLGLYIVRQLVEAHRGSIRVESRLGDGAVFTVALPLTTEAELPVAAASLPA